MRPCNATIPIKRRQTFARLPGRGAPFRVGFQPMYQSTDHIRSSPDLRSGPDLQSSPIPAGFGVLRTPRFSVYALLAAGSRFGRRKRPDLPLLFPVCLALFRRQYQQLIANLGIGAVNAPRREFQHAVTVHAERRKPKRLQRLDQVYDAARLVQIHNVYRKKQSECVDASRRSHP